jgi:hypothetical protein
LRLCTKPAELDATAVDKFTDMFAKPL